MSVEDLKQAIRDKVAAGSLTDNGDGTVPGKNEVYKDPPGRQPGTLNARWGDAPPPPVTHGTSVEEAAKDGREGMADRLFNAVGPSAQSEQALVRTLFNLETVSQGHMPHSIMQRRGRTKTASVADETLTEQVRRVTGQR